MTPVPESDPKVNGLSSDEITDKFKEIVKSNGIDDEVSEVIMKDAELKGEGFASLTSLVTITFRDSSLKPLNLFVKSVTQNPSHMKFLEDTKIFEKESMFLMEYVPVAKAFCEKKGHGDLLNIYPKCYFGDTKMVVLENLVLDKGFELLDKMEQQDMHAAKLALTTLAKHHAISWSVIQDMGGPDVFFEKFPTLRYEPISSPQVKGMMEPCIKDAITTSIDVLNRSSGKDKEEAKRILQNRRENLWDFITEILGSKSDHRVLVLNHGDYWNNNMMFLRDKTTGELVGHKAIDLQGIRHDSPATDLGYYLFSTVKPEVRRKHLQNLLQHYLDVFNETTLKLENPANLTYDELFASFRYKFQFGFWFCGMMLSNKASFMAMKDIDITTIDMNQMGAIMAGLIKKWLDENPDACEEEAVGIVKMLDEYKSLKI